MDQILTYTTASGGPLVPGDANPTPGTYVKRGASGSGAFGPVTATSTSTSGPDFSTAPATITTTATLAGLNSIVRIDATGSSFTVTLPPAASVAGLWLTLKRIDS